MIWEALYEYNILEKNVFLRKIIIYWFFFYLFPCPCSQFCSRWFSHYIRFRPVLAFCGGICCTTFVPPKMTCNLESACISRTWSGSKSSTGSCRTKQNLSINNKRITQFAEIGRGQSLLNSLYLYFCLHNYVFSRIQELSLFKWELAPESDMI